MKLSVTRRCLASVAILSALGWRTPRILAEQPKELPLLPSDAGVADKSRAFVMAICTDRRGNLWTANEDGGVWRMDPYAESGKQWTHFTTKDGLGDDYAYAIDCDNLGRVWVGHLNRGVSVFDGKTWQNYDVAGGIESAKSLSGPIGDHVCAITACRSTGDVWMATSAGLTRYIEFSKTWVNYTRRDGLHTDQATAITFDPAGNIYVATPCDGVVMADAADGYSRWRWIMGHDAILTEPVGRGLASNRVNDILYASDGSLYVATSMGLSWSSDRGQHWQFERGADWADKVINSAAGPGPNFSSETTHDLLPEDFVTALAEDPLGYIWVGYRGRGVQRLKRQGDTFTAVAGNPAGKGRVKSLLSSFDGFRGLVGNYGKGILPLETYANEPKVPPTTRPADTATPPLPPAAAPPDLAVLNAELSDMAKVSAIAPTTPFAITMEDDWRTRGDWMGRYGRYWCVFCGMDSGEYEWGSGPAPLDHYIGLGPHHQPNDVARYWIAELYNSNPRTLEIPSIYMSSRVMHQLTTWEKNRRQGEMNDNGEVYPATYEGPDLYTNVHVPEGNFILSLYFLNDDGHKGKNALRDYEIVLRNQGDTDVRDLTAAASQPVAARSRVVDFWAGVYKRFLVHGPANFSVQIARDYSMNVILSAIMLDQFDEKPAPYFTSFEDRDKAVARQVADMQKNITRPAQASTEAEAVGLLTDQLEQLSEANPQWWAINHRRISLLLLRWYLARHEVLSKQDQSRLTTCLYRAGLYPYWEACQIAGGLRTARNVEKSLRWDGIQPDSTRHGYELVTKYLNSPPATQP